MIYRQEIDIPSYLCDVDDRLHVWAAVRLCQEVTEYHGNATGIGFTTLLAQNRAWVITRAYYNIIRLPMSFERVVLSTWSRGNNGLIAYRDYLMETPDGERLLEGTSCWPMIDMTTRRVLRLNDIIANYENHSQCATPFETLPKLHVSEMGDENLVATHNVRYTMLDHTQHVNNSEYIKLLFDCLQTNGFSTDGKFSLSIAYNHESRLGDTLNVYRKHEQNVDEMKITNSRGPSITAVISK